MYPPTAAGAGRKHSFRHRCFRRRIPGLLSPGFGTEKRRCSSLAVPMNKVRFSRRWRSCTKTGASRTWLRKKQPAPFISMPFNPGKWTATGACTMRCSLSLLVAVAILVACVLGLAQSRPYNLGTPLSQEEIRNFDFMVGPEGKELPPGRGTAKEGAEIFAKRCAVCHGRNGEGGAAQRLVLGGPGNPYRGPFKDTEKTATSYYPYPTIAWDYINRAMPANKPGSLTHDEVRSEEHTSELQSRVDLVCRLLLERTNANVSITACGLTPLL